MPIQEYTNNNPINNKIMKRLLFIASLFFTTLISNTTYAQNKDGHFTQEEFRNRQKEFFIQRAELTPEEAEKFFPVYFELQDKKTEYNREVWKNIRKGNNKNTTDAEYSKITEDIIKTKITIDKLELEYLE